LGQYLGNINTSLSERCSRLKNKGLESACLLPSLRPLTCSWPPRSRRCRSPGRRGPHAACQPPAAARRFSPLAGEPCLCSPSSQAAGSPSLASSLFPRSLVVVCLAMARASATPLRQRIRAPLPRRRSRGPLPSSVAQICPDLTLPGPSPSAPRSSAIDLPIRSCAMQPPLSRCPPRP
jgi:hypothetical protein